MARDMVLNIPKLKSLIRSKGYRVDWLAEQVGISANTLRAILCGSRNPRRPIIKLLAIALSVSESELVDGEEIAG